MYFADLAFLIVFFVMFQLMPKQIRHKTYFARVKMLLIAALGMCLDNCFGFSFVLLRLGSQTLCFVFAVNALGVCDHMTVWRTTTAIMDPMVSAVSAFCFYMFLGHSLTTSIFLLRLQRAISPNAITKLGRSYMLLVPMWEHVVVACFALLMTSQVFASVLVSSIAMVVLGVDLSFVVELVVIVRMAIIGLIAVIETVVLVIVVINMVRSRNSHRMRLNYIALLATFIVPFTVLVATNVIGILAGVVESVLLVGRASDMLIDWMRTTVYLLMVLAAWFILLQFAAIALFHIIMLQNYRHRITRQQRAKEVTIMRAGRKVRL